jgi:hypothetical protein
MPKSVASHIGEKLTKSNRVGSRRELEHEFERVGSRHKLEHEVERVGPRREFDGPRRREGFEVDGDYSWLWGSLFIILVVFALSPGVLLTLPPGKGGVWMSGQTSKTAAFVHAALLALLFNYI